MLSEWWFRDVNCSTPAFAIADRIKTHYGDGLPLEASERIDQIVRRAVHYAHHTAELEEPANAEAPAQPLASEGSCPLGPGDRNERYAIKDVREEVRELRASLQEQIKVIQEELSALQNDQVLMMESAQEAPPIDIGVQIMGDGIAPGMLNAHINTPNTMPPEMIAALNNMPKSIKLDCLDVPKSIHHIPGLQTQKTTWTCCDFVADQNVQKEDEPVAHKRTSYSSQELDQIGEQIDDFVLRMSRRYKGELYGWLAEKKGLVGEAAALYVQIISATKQPTMSDLRSNIGHNKLMRSEFVRKLAEMNLKYGITFPELVDHPPFHVRVINAVVHPFNRFLGVLRRTAVAVLRPRVYIPDEIVQAHMKSVS
jgi:hypothetical protein